MIATSLCTYHIIRHNKAIFVCQVYNESCTLFMLCCILFLHKIETKAKLNHVHSLWDLLYDMLLNFILPSPGCISMIIPLASFPAGVMPVIGDAYFAPHYCDGIMGAVASEITSLTVVYSTVYSDADQRIHQSSASLAFVRVIHRRPVNSPHK